MDFKELELLGMKVEENNHCCVVLDLLDFDVALLDACDRDEKFDDYKLIQETGMNATTFWQNEEALKATTRMFETLRHARESRGVTPNESKAQKALPSRVRKKMTKAVKELRGVFQALGDDGQTFVWELFAGHFIVSRLSIEGGHVVGQPIDIDLGTDLLDPEVAEQVLLMIKKHKQSVMRGPSEREFVK